MGDVIPKLLEIKTKFNTPIKFHVRIEVGDGKNQPSDDVTRKVNAILKDIKDEMRLR